MTARLATLACTILLLAGFLAAQERTPATQPTPAGPPPAQGPVGPQPGGAPGDGGQAVPPMTNKGKPIPKGCWFDPIHLDFGSVVENTKEFVEGEFKFENPTDSEQKILSIVPSCKCQHLELVVNGRPVKIEFDREQKLKEPIVIPPHAKGALKLRLNVMGGPQHRTGDIRIETTDPGMPAFVLTAEAVIEPLFQVEPQIVRLGRMDPRERRDWTVKVRHRFKKEWKITKVLEPLPEGMQVLSMTPSKTKDGVVYEIKGSYGPDLPEGSIGGFITFETDGKNELFQVQIDADVRQRVNIDRVFWSYNRFKRSEGAVHTVYLWPAEGTAAFHVTRVEPFYSLNPIDCLETKILPPKEGSNEIVEIPGLEAKPKASRVWRVQVRIKPGCPGHAVRMKLRIHFAERDLVPKVVHFNGFPYDG